MSGTGWKARGAIAVALLLAVPALVAPLPAQERPPEGAASDPAALRNRVELDLSYVRFDDTTEPWRLASLSVERRAAFGTVIGRLNLADRFGEAGVQLEADAYPTLGEGTYAYLNAGRALSGVFPEWRYGAELFRGVGGGWEASAGVRHLRFEGDDVTLWTGSVGKYVGNYWLSLRPYARWRDDDLSASASLTARRYFADAEHYLGARLGYGSTPGDRLTPGELERASSLAAAVEGRRGLTPALYGAASLGYEREELSLDRRRDRWELTLGLRRAF